MSSLTSSAIPDGGGSEESRETHSLHQYIGIIIQLLVSEGRVVIGSRTGNIKREISVY
jgi:hypothetical protein